MPVMTNFSVKCIIMNSHQIFNNGHLLKSFHLQTVIVFMWCITKNCFCKSALCSRRLIKRTSDKYTFLITCRSYHRTEEKNWIHKTAIKKIKTKRINNKTEWTEGDNYNFMNSHWKYCWFFNFWFPDIRKPFLLG